MSHAILRHALLAAVLLSPAAKAEPDVPRLNYATYIGGLDALDLDASIAISPERYRLQVSYRLTGLVGAIVHGQGDSIVDGRFQDNTPVPRELFSAGQFRGRPYVMRVDWQEGRPVIMQQDPPDRIEREPVPLEQQLHTIDALSALAALLRQVAATGRCDGALHTFDGRRLSEFQAHTVGQESLPETSRSTFTGTALRCDFQGRQLGGFAVGEDQDRRGRIQHGSAWFAALAPGQPPVPVRIAFHAGGLGDATMYLTGQS